MNKTSNSIRVNFIVNIFLNGSAYILPFLTKPYVSRILQVEGMGKVSFATSLISYFTMFAMLGVPTYGIRACARVRDSKEKLEKTVYEIFFMNLILAVIVYAAFFAALFFSPALQEKKTLLAWMSISILLNVIGMDWFYKAIEEYVILAIRSLVFKLIALVMIFLFIRSTEDYLLYGVCTVIASFGANIANFLGVRKKIDFTPVTFEGMRAHFAPTLVFFAMSVATTIYTNLDVVMLEFMTNDTQVGYYDATLTLKLVLIGAVSSLGAVLLPRVSYYIEKGMRREFENVTKRAFNCILLMAVPLVVYFLMYAEDTVMLLSGKGFEGAVAPMKILMPTVLFIGLTNISGIQMLVPLGREKIVLYSEIAGALVDLLINLALIPRYGAAGAAIGTLAAEFVVLIMQFLSLKREILRMFRKIDVWKVLAAALGAAVFAGGILYTDLNFLLRLIISACIYFGIYGIILLILKETELMQLLETAKEMLEKKEREK